MVCVNGENLRVEVSVYFFVGFYVFFFCVIKDFVLVFYFDLI